MSREHILVTGGSGFIGGALVSQLVKNGYRVKVLDNQSRGTRTHLKDVMDNIELIEADIRDAEAVYSAIKGVDRVFHLAFVNGTEFFYSQPDLVLDVGIKGMINVVDGCIKAGVKDLFVASSSEVYQAPAVVPTDESAAFSIPDPLNPRYSYATGKIVSEIMAINYGRKFFERVVIFRPHNVYGPNMGWEHVIPQFIIRMLPLCEKTSDQKIEFPIKGTGQETRAFCYIDDFIDGLMILNEKGEHLGIYHIGTDEEVTIEHLAMEIGKYFGKDIETIAGEVIKGGTSRRCPDISKIKVLGFQPKFRLTDGVPLITEWYVKNASFAPEKLVTSA